MTTAPRQRRIPRKAALAAVAIVLLPFVYLAFWLTLSWGVNHGVVGAGFGAALRPAFKPLILYCDLQQPGSATLHKLWWSVSSSADFGDKQPGWFLAPSLPRPE